MRGKACFARRFVTTKRQCIPKPPSARARKQQLLLLKNMRPLLCFLQKLLLSLLLVLVSLYAGGWMLLPLVLLPLLVLVLVRWTL